ncbi:MAG: PEP-CTERM sorting domain-containing protein [Paracoccaceae bacterium]
MPVAASTLLDFETGARGLPTEAGLFDEAWDGGIYSGVDPYRQFQRDFGVVLDVLDDENGRNIRARNPLALFDSACNAPGRPACTGGDPDLATGSAYGTPEEGRILIINERPSPAVGRTTAPDDSAAGGTIVFDFTDPGGVRVDDLVLIDLDERASVSDAIRFDFKLSGGGEVILTGADAKDADVPEIGVQLALGSPLGDNAHRTYSFSGVDRVAELQVTFLDISGGIASLRYARAAEVPVPATLPLLLAGLGGLWAWRRRGAD